MSSASIPSNSSGFGLTDIASSPADSGEIRMTDTEPATQMSMSEAVKNLLDPTRGQPGTADSISADTGTTDFDTTVPADVDAQADSDNAATRADTRAMAPTPSDGSEVVRSINSLLRGEIAAAETYRDAVEKIAGGDHADSAGLLRELQREHGRAAQSLRDRIRELGGQPADSSGAWGAWSQIVQGTMSLFGGDKGAIKALKEGEEHGLKDYSDVVPEADPTTAQLIQNQLIPAQERHIAMLDQMMGVV